MPILFHISPLTDLTDPRSAPASITHDSHPGMPANSSFSDVVAALTCGGLISPIFAEAWLPCGIFGGAFTAPMPFVPTAETHVVELGTS